MRLAPLFAVALAALPAAPRAQTGFALTPADPSQRTITVTGVGAAEAPADLAVIRFAVETQAPTLDEAMTKHTDEVERVRRVLRAAGVPDSNVILDRLALGDESDEIEDAVGRSAFGESDDAVTVARLVSVKVDDLDAVPGLVATIARESEDPLAVRRMDVSAGFEVRDPTALRHRALRLAMRDARARAVLVAGEAGARLGRTLSVTEGGVTGSLLAGGGGSMAGLATRMAMGGGGGGTQTESVSVVVVYALDE